MKRDLLRSSDRLWRIISNRAVSLSTVIFCGQPWITATGNVIPPSPHACGAVDIDREGIDSVTYPLIGRRRATPVRLTLANELGHDIDGAWWPRTDRISGELPDLVVTLNARLGEISGITINWPPLQRPPDLNWHGWQHKNQHVMTVQGREACANVLIVPYATNSALATMVLRLAANLPITRADQETSPFRTAGSILCAAQHQRSADTSATASV